MEILKPRFLYFLVSKTFLRCGCAFQIRWITPILDWCQCNVILTALAKYEADIIEMSIVFVIKKKSQQTERRHYDDVIMGTIASQIPSLTIVYWTVYSGADTKAPRHWPLCGQFTGSSEFPAQMASNTKNVSIWWSHHGNWFSNPQPKTSVYLFLRQNSRAPLHTMPPRIFW